MTTHFIRRSSYILSFLAIAIAAPTRAGDPTSSPTVELPLNRLVGQRLASFSLKDANGKTVSLYGFRGKRAVVLAFLGIDCPVANLYAPRLAELSQAYKDKGVVFLGINSNAHETAEQITAHAKEHGIDFPVLKDEGNVVADMALVERTCEVIVLDGLALVRYRGAIDDQYGVGTHRDAPEHNYLRDALDEVLSGGRVEPKATPVAGCLIDRVEAKPSKAAAISNASRVRAAPREIVEASRSTEEKLEVGAVTYAADVATIVQNKCQSCHRPGEVGPFPLLSYDDVRKHSAMIREVVDERRMPPWHADPRFGHFSNDRRLSSKERATLLAWVDQGTPLGDVSKLPAARSFPDGWGIGTPDMVFEIPEAFTVPAQGTVDYVHIRVPTKFPEDMWVQAAEAKPGNRAVVHHIIVYVDDHKFAKENRMRRVDSHLCGYAPGDLPSVYPEGTAKKVPAGSDLLFQIHYTPDGKVKTDRSKVGLIFAKAPVEHRAYTLGIAQRQFELPPGEADIPVRSSHTFEADARLLSFMPHMHLRGKSFRYEATYPDGRKETLLSVPAFDFGWQSYYTLAEPKAMPKGTTIDCLAYFDNSADNPYNPDPKKTVRWGEQTWEEMMIGYIDFTDDAPVKKADVEAKPDRGTVLLRALRVLNNAAERQKK